MLKHLCPCCRRHCYLDELRCRRGAEYVETGVIPPRRRKPGDNKSGKSMSEEKKQYMAMDRESKLLWNIRGMERTIRMLEEAGQDGMIEQGALNPGEMFACLKEEDRADLLMLLEKVKHDWRRRYEEKDDGHGHQNAGHSSL